MDATDFRKRGKEMVDYIADYMENIQTRRVLPEVQPGYLREMIPNRAPKKGEDWTDIMRDVDKAIMPGITHWQHPRFHAYFPAGNSYPSILGDMLSDAIGCVGFSWAASPACTELETLVLDWLAKMIGLPPVFLHEHGLGGGVIQGSASDCVLVSLLAARFSTIKDLKNKFPFVEEGVLLSRMVAYCSKMAHSCAEKAGLISMVKMRELDMDENYSLRGPTLEKAIAEDRKLGLIPFYVCATLGTTAVCSFDNLHELGLVCEKEAIWLHVDAAYAGSAFICPEHQHFIKGIEHANSFNTNPTKWMLVNFDCSTMWVRDRKLLTTALTVDPLYLQHHHADKAVDFRHWGIPLSRRFRSLKLWFVIRTYGVEGLQKYIREHCRLAKKLEVLVKKDCRFEVLGKVHMGLVCFRLKGHNYKTQMLLRAINMSGKLHMVPALINDNYVIRFAICAQDASDDDIIFAWNVISEMASDVIAACDNNQENEAMKVIKSIESLDLGPDKLPAEIQEPNNYKEEVPIDDEEVFLYDDNIPSIPSIPTLYEKKLEGTNRRRNMLLRMISDPKCYNPRVLKSMCHEKRRRSDIADVKQQNSEEISTNGADPGYVFRGPNSLVQDILQAICAQDASEVDINFSWNVIAEMARDVIAACDYKENEVMKVIKWIESLDLGPDELQTEIKEPNNYKEDVPIDGEEVSLYDDNIPSIPSIPMLYEKKLEGTNGLSKTLSRTISDPKSYDPRILKSMCDEKRQRSDIADVK